MTVFDLKKGERAQVVGIGAEGGALARLSALGVVEGAQVEALGFSLFRGSVLLACGSVRIAVRRAVALKIRVKKCA